MTPSEIKARFDALDSERKNRIIEKLSTAYLALNSVLVAMGESELRYAELYSIPNNSCHGTISEMHQAIYNIEVIFKTGKP